MYINYFNSLKQHITSQLPRIKHIDWYNGQYNRFNETKAVPLPALYIEFGRIQWNSLGNGLQTATNATIRFHLVTYDVDDSPENNLSLSNQLFVALHQHKIMDNNSQLSTALMRTSSELITDYDQIKIVIIEFETTLYDNSAVPNTVLANIDNLNVGGL